MSSCTRPQGAATSDDSRTSPPCGPRGADPVEPDRLLEQRLLGPHAVGVALGTLRWLLVAGGVYLIVR